MLSNEDILRLYQDKNFPGSFSGVRNFQLFLKTKLNEYVPEKKLFEVLKTLPLYIVHQKPIRKFPRRHYDVRSFGQCVQVIFKLDF